MMQEAKRVTMKELICIVCPKGCHLQVDEEQDYTVTGNTCARGAAYGKKELTHPTRVVTSTVRCTGGAHPRCPVKTNEPLPKEYIAQALRTLDGLTVTAPIHTGDVVVTDLCGTGIAFVATRDI